MKQGLVREIFDRLRNHHLTTGPHLEVDARLLVRVLMPHIDPRVPLERLPYIKTEQHFERPCSENGQLYDERLSIYWPARSEGRLRIEHAVAASMPEPHQRAPYLPDATLIGNIVAGRAQLRTLITDPLSGERIAMTTTPGQLETLFRICLHAAEAPTAALESFPVASLLPDKARQAQAIVQSQMAVSEARLCGRAYSVYPRAL